MTHTTETRATITKHGRDAMNRCYTVTMPNGKTYYKFFHTLAEAEKFIEDYYNATISVESFDFV